MSVNLTNREPNRLQAALSELRSVQPINTAVASQAIIDKSCEELRALNPVSIEPLISFLQTVLQEVRLSPTFPIQDPVAKALRLRINELQDEARSKADKKK